jgi:ribose transport system substrate-binding protein
MNEGLRMRKLRFLLSVTNEENDFQIAQADAARAVASRLGADLEVVSADDDGVKQIGQLLERIQSTTVRRPDAILLEPAGSTPLPQVGQAAVAAGVGWGILSRDANYLEELRSTYKVPAFIVAPDHEEIGRIQGRQLSALLPGGGTVLYIEGPSQSVAARQRHTGMMATKSANVQLRGLKAHWSEVSACKAVTSWLKLCTAKDTQIAAVCAQDDSMAMGARKALQACTHARRDIWLAVPFLGCDGMPQTGQEWVRKGLLAATVYSPPTAPIAVELMARFFEHGTMPPVRTLTETTSIPAIEALAPRASGVGAGMTK